MKKYLNNFIYKIKNMYTLFKIMHIYSDIIDIDYFLNIIDSNIKTINNIFHDSKQYDFDFRILKLNQLKDVILEVDKRNDPELVRNGYSIYSIIEYYKKEYLYLIVNCIQYLNPVYDIIKLDISDNKLNMVLDSWINCNDMIDILNKIYNNDYIITYEIKKIYSKDRVGYSIDIESTQLYNALKYFIVDLNGKIREYISPIIMDLNNIQKTQLYKYISNFSNINISVLERLEYGNKEEIISIIKSHYRLMESIETKIKY